MKDTAAQLSRNVICIRSVAHPPRALEGEAQIPILLDTERFGEHFEPSP